LKLADEVQELGIVESAPLQDGRNMVMMLAPHKNAPVTSPADAAPEPDSEAAPQPEGDAVPQPESDAAAEPAPEAESEKAADPAPAGDTT
jgi:translation initiation factor IF-3